MSDFSCLLLHSHSYNSYIIPITFILAALNDVCLLAYANFFQSGLSKVNTGPPEVPYWNTYQIHATPYALIAVFQSYLQDSFEVFSEHSLSVIVYRRGPRDSHVQTRSLLSKEIYCFSFSTIHINSL